MRALSELESVVLVWLKNDVLIKQSLTDNWQLIFKATINTYECHSDLFCIKIETFLQYFKFSKYLSL